jgi:hypothetical protein
MHNIGDGEVCDPSVLIKPVQDATGSGIGSSIRESIKPHNALCSSS